MDSFDCVVVGAGVVGLAVARELAAAGRETLIVDRHPAIGMETSSRNSEVIHAGLYYAPGSLKANTCRRGRDLLYDYCERRGVPHRRCGKLIVATKTSQLDELDRIRSIAFENGVQDLQALSRDEALALEPELRCVGGLLSPSTGIIDSHSYMLSLLGDAEQHGATLALQCRIMNPQIVRGGVELHVEQETDGGLHARWLINAAGLTAIDLARQIDGFPQQHIPQAYFAKGSYFVLSGRAPFSHLVYPVPEPGGLGVHLTLDLDGRARFGPDVEWVEQIDYDVDPERSARFQSSIRKYWPGLREGALRPAYAGVRPKLAGPGEPPADFRIEGPAIHGVTGVINLFGIESPGLTASLAIAEQVAAIVGDA